MKSSLRRRARRAVTISVLLVAATTVAACGSDEAGGSGSGGDSVRIAYIQKQGDQQYFVDEANGAKAAAEEAGADVTVINVGDDSNKAINEVDTAISQGYDGIIVVVPDANVGPQVMAAAQDAGIPLLASDDAIEDGNGQAAPFVGFDGTDMGTKVGDEAGRLFQEAGWTAANTKIIRVSKEDLQTCEDRNDGALTAFEQVTGVSPEVIRVGSDATVINSQDQTTAALASAGNPDHWVVWGCNDESETGAVTALQNSGVSPSDIIGVGLGAYLTCKDWQAGTETGNRAALYISGEDVGRTAVETMLTALRDGSDLPPNTVAPTTMVDATTYESAGVVCS